MAENSLSQAVSFLNDNSTMEIGVTAQGQPAARSDIVAYHFGKSHKNVLRDIVKLRGKCPESFYRLNFERVDYTDSKGEKRPAYLLTRDGFTLLVMGFTGANAVKWKIRYIEAFNALEAAVREDRASIARETGYREGLEEARGKTARVWRFGPVKKRRLRSAVRYRKMGLGIHAIAKLLDVSNREISDLLKAAEDLGFLSGRPARPVRDKLLTLDARGVEA